MFSIEGLMTSPATNATEEGTTSNVQMEADLSVKNEIDSSVSAGEGADEPPAKQLP